MVLAQPRRFESIGPFPDVLEADHLVVAEGPQGEVAHLGGRPAGVSGAALTHSHENAVPGRDCLFGLDRDLYPGVQKASRVSGYLLGPYVCPGIRKPRADHEHDLGVEELDRRSEVPLRPTLIDPPHDREVALGHRGRSISCPARTKRRALGAGVTPRP